MDVREKMMQILDKPVFPADKPPLEAVTDYLLENDVVPVVKCKDCRYFNQNPTNEDHFGVCKCPGTPYSIHTTPNFYCFCGERRDLDATD